MARKIMVEDPVHPKYQDPSTPFDVWLDYMEENYPEYNALHFYETEELIANEDLEEEEEVENDTGFELDEEGNINYEAVFEATPEEREELTRIMEQEFNDKNWWEKIVDLYGRGSDVITKAVEATGVPAEAMLALGLVTRNPSLTKEGGKGMLKSKIKKSIVPTKRKSKAEQARDRANADNKAKAAQKKTDDKTKADKDNASAEGRAAEKHTDPAQKATTEKTQSRDLTGNRDKDGSLIPAMTDAQKTLAKVGVGTVGLGLLSANELANNALTEEDFTKEAEAIKESEAPKVKQSKSPEGTVYPGENKDDMITGKQIAEPSTEEKPGWQQNPGDNWWSVNTESPYWQTQEGAKEAFDLYGKKPAWAAAVDKEEFDFVEFKDLLGLK